jgi:mRNA interferase MazF
VVAHRFEVYLVNLDPTIESEIRKTRPYVIVSPNELNHYIHTVIVAPMTTKGQPYPSRVRCTFGGRQAQIVLDQLRTVDRARLVKSIGRIPAAAQREILTALSEMFAP